MNFRRYALFLLVAILTFVIGVAAAALFGNISPFSHGYQMRRRCVRLSALPAPKDRFTVYTVYREDGTIVRPYYIDKTYGLERLADETGKATESLSRESPEQIPSKDK